MEIQQIHKDINMDTITHSQVQELVRQLPKAKLPFAYRLLQELTNKNVTQLPPQADFMRYSINERRHILASQAERLKTHYEQTAEERQGWQAGDFLDEY